MAAIVGRRRLWVGGQVPLSMGVGKAFRKAGEEKLYLLSSIKKCRVFAALKFTDIAGRHQIIAIAMFRQLPWFHTPGRIGLC